MEKRSHAKHRLSDSQEDARFCRARRHLPLFKELAHFGRVAESTLRDRLNRLAAKGQVGSVTRREMERTRVDVPLRVSCREMLDKARAHWDRPGGTQTNGNIQAPSINPRGSLPPASND